MGTHSLGRTSRFTHRYTLAPRDILPLLKSVLVAERQLRARECFHDPSTPVVVTLAMKTIRSTSDLKGHTTTQLFAI